MKKQGSIIGHWIDSVGKPCRHCGLTQDQIWDKSKKGIDVICVGKDITWNHIKQKFNIK